MSRTIFELADLALVAYAGPGGGVRDGKLTVGPTRYQASTAEQVVELERADLERLAIALAHELGWKLGPRVTRQARRSGSKMPAHHGRRR